jgi:hypothetical protein
MFLPFVPPLEQFREGKKHQVWDAAFTDAIAFYTFFKHFYTPISYMRLHLAKVNEGQM